jgi:hypothetical protein
MSALDYGQVLLAFMFLASGYCLVKGSIVAAHRKRLEGQE